MSARLPRFWLVTCSALLALSFAGSRGMSAGSLEQPDGSGPKADMAVQIREWLAAVKAKGAPEADVRKKLPLVLPKRDAGADLWKQIEAILAKAGAPAAPPGQGKPVDSLALLLPDTIDVTDPRVTIWTDAIAEEGLPLAVLRDSEFLAPGFDATSYAGVILPDQVHVNAGDDLIAALERYVSEGGNLMLVFDAGSLTSDGFYPAPKSRLSQLAGIDYALYEELRDYTFGFGPVVATEKTFTALRVPPGKFVPYDGQFTDVPVPVDVPDGKISSVEGFAADLFAATGYIYGYLAYPGFVTRGSYRGTPLLTSPSFGLAAGYNAYGEGGVLFVNMPLGYLKHQTDGAFMHGFLHYFAADILHLPYLAAVPKARGGLVMNLHLDSKLAEAPLMELDRMGVFEQGPYSIDITAGPDTEAMGDGIGFDLPRNVVMQQMLRHFTRRGHEVGCHGGWIHNYFGLNVSELNQAEFEPFLGLNKNAVEAATGRQVLEYSAPMGNEPEWATTWLEQRGVLAYYFMGNTGMAPTRSYRNGRLLNKSIWSVPLSTYGKYASFEEFGENGVSSDQASSWLVALTNFAVQQRVSRMVYYHPPGIMEFTDALQTWLTRAAQFKLQGRFQWYTMAELAQFLNRREQVTWNTLALPDGTRVFHAHHPEELKSFAWVLPKGYYERPVVTKGQGSIYADLGHARIKLRRSAAVITEDDDEWVVTAKGGQELQFTAKPINR